MQSLRIFLALLRHDLTILRKQWISRCINTVCLTSTEIILFGFLFPRMGMPTALIGPTFLGTLIFVLNNFGFSFALRWSMDQRYNRIIDYHLTLPICKTWLFASYITSFIIESIILTGPVIMLGFWFLRNTIIFQIKPFAFSAIYLLTLLFFSLFFLGSAFIYDAHYFDDHIWPRRINPLYCLSSTVVPWKTIYAFNAYIAYAFLLNPVTFLIEGLRSGLFNASGFLSWYICLPISMFFVVFMIIRMSNGINKQLDPV